MLLSCGKKIRLGEWTISDLKESTSPINWCPFIWANDSIGNKYYKRVAMFIPVTIEGLPGNFQFQFDLGTNLTSLQGNTMNSLLKRYPQQNRMRTYKDVLLFEDMVLSFGNTKAFSKNCYVMPDYGPVVPATGFVDSTPVKIGSIGSDMFQARFLVIDYPQQRFAVSDSLPHFLRPEFVSMSLDDLGRVILPMEIGGKTYKVMFDTGSSQFSLIIPAGKIDKFSASAGQDTMAVSSWGKTHNVIGRPLNQPFFLAGQPFSNVMVYADYRKEAESDDYDAIAGNALFWNRAVIIDFKNKKFGVK